MSLTGNFSEGEYRAFVTQRVNARQNAFWKAVQNILMSRSYSYQQRKCREEKICPGLQRRMLYQTAFGTVRKRCD